MAKSKPDPKKEKAKAAPVPATGASQAATVVKLRATASDTTAAAKLPNATKPTNKPISRTEADLVVESAEALLAFAPTLQASKTIDVAATIAAAKAAQGKLDLAERFQGSADAARASAKRATAPIVKFAKAVDEVVSKADPESPLGAALASFHSGRAAAIGTPARAHSMRKTAEEKRKAAGTKK